MMWWFGAGLVAGAAAVVVALRQWRTKPTGEVGPGDPRERLAELSEATGGLAHEIRNPLSTLKVNLDLLAEDWREVDETDPDIRRRSLVRIGGMQQEAERLQRILDDFMRFAGRHEVDLKPTDVNAVIQRVVDFTASQAAGAGIRVRPSLWPGGLRCMVDENLLEQALLNLFMNAQQAMPEGGDLMVKSQACDGRARLDIADTGTGIAAEVMDKIFRAYYSTKKDGTGLGLSVTRRIVAEHGGTIDVESEVGKGTIFTIHLPLIGERAQGSARRA